jgi:predicted DNA-binding protein
MDSLTVKLPRTLNRRLADRARQIGRSKSDLAREWIEQALAEQNQPSCYDLMKNACGHFAGPRDGSIKEGFDD